MSATSEPRGVAPDFDLVSLGPSGERGAQGIRATGGEVPHLNPSVAALRERFPGAVLGNQVMAGDEDVVYVDPSRIVEVLRWLREDPGQHYDHLADVTAVDYGGGRPIEVVYQLWSIPRRASLRLKCELPLDALEVDSATAIWEGANWLEREVYDMYGVEFRGHPDMRRILMPDGYAEGHPLRKDFPLRGRFSRAEQTRRSLTRDPEDHYTPGEIGGREPQLVAPHDERSDGDPER